MAGRLALILCLFMASASSASAQDVSAIAAQPQPLLSRNLPAGLSASETSALEKALPKAGRLAAGDMDTALIGKWKGYRSWPLAGSDQSILFLTIEPSGRTIALLVSPGYGQSIDVGRILASNGVLSWQSGWDGTTVMAYAIENDRVRFIPAFGAPFSLQRDVQGP